MASDYLAADALIYARQSLSDTVQWAYDYLAEHYGLEGVAGDEQLPGSLHKVMSALVHLTNEVTDMGVEVGAYRRRDDGALMQPMYYSANRPVCLQRMIGPVDEQIEGTCLQHPNGQPDPVRKAGTRRAGLHVEGGGNNE